MTTHVFAPRLKRGKEGEGVKHFLVHCYPEEQLRTHQQLSFFYSPPFLPPPLISFLLPPQAKPFCPLSRAIWCLFSVLVCPTDVWRLAPSVVQSAVRVRPLLVIQGVD